MICAPNRSFPRKSLGFYVFTFKQRWCSLSSHLPFFKCSIAARKMWRCQLQTKVSCGSLWTASATWYLCALPTRAPGLQGRWKGRYGVNHDVRTFVFKNFENRSAGRVWKWGLYFAGEFGRWVHFVGVLGRKLRRTNDAVHSGWIPDETTHGHIGQLDSQLQAKKVIDKKIIGQTATGN